MSDSIYRCRSCGWETGAERTHCPHCLSAIHEEDEEGYECGGTLQPISVWVKDDGGWDIIGRCSICGELESYPMAQDDNPLAVLSIASKPLAMPPFPIEKTEELTRMMGGQGDMEGYSNEQGE